MNEEVYGKYKLAGQIAAKARNFGKELIKPGASLLDVATKVEGLIREEGAGLSFPVNISINEVAAHYTPTHDDSLFFRKGDIVKLDVGTHIDGYIADTALTVEVESNNFEDMIKASSDALDNAIELMKPGISFTEIGKKIETTIDSNGYKPIDNLTGHSLERYKLHSGVSVPNVSTAFSRAKPREGNVFAIEPFATNGAGHVVSGKGSNIYICNSSVRSRIVRDTRSKILFQRLRNEYKTLPFAQRWTEKLIPNSQIFLRRLAHLGLIKEYPQLIEANAGIITQKEHTVIVTDQGCEVTTE
jgi:methionyl aminopeptidase